jgi:hypothetical protein
LPDQREVEAIFKMCAFGVVLPSYFVDEPGRFIRPGTLWVVTGRFMQCIRKECPSGPESSNHFMEPPEVDTPLLGLHHVEVWTTVGKCCLITAVFVHDNAEVILDINDSLPGEKVTETGRDCAIF